MTGLGLLRAIELKGARIVVLRLKSGRIFRGGEPLLGLLSASPSARTKSEALMPTMFRLAGTRRLTAAIQVIPVGLRRGR